MANCTITCWQEIPSMVEARSGRERHKIELSQRFQELIDMMAMRRGMAGTDAYLEQWKKQPAASRDQPVREAAEALAAEIEESYDAIRKAALAAGQ